MRSKAVALAMALAGVLAACGSGGGTGEDVTIVFTAADVAHDFTVEGAEVHVGADAGKTAKGGLRIDEPGTYPYVCTVPGHEAAGMRGRLTVTEA